MILEIVKIKQGAYSFQYQDSISDKKATSEKLHVLWIKIIHSSIANKATLTWDFADRKGPESWIPKKYYNSHPFRCLNVSHFEKNAFSQGLVRPDSYRDSNIFPFPDTKYEIEFV